MVAAPLLVYQPNGWLNKCRLVLLHFGEAPTPLLRSLFLLPKRRRCLVFLWLLLLPGVSAAQASLSGTVRDSLTQAPLAFASVFLANTTLGATTTEQGHFAFAHVPPGTYEVVASYLGYRLAKQTITVGTAAQQLILQLGPTANRLGEVMVRARPTRTRPEDYQKFVELFLGTTTFSQQCRIRNPKEVRVYYDAQTKELTASANNFVQVENRALGYRLKYFGFQFRCNFEQQVVLFYGQPVFEELRPRSSRQQRQWAANRLAAYQGSLTHFLKSVRDNRVTAEGFKAQKLSVVPNPRFPRADSARQALLGLRQNSVFSPADQDSLRRWRAVPASFVLLYSADRPIDSLRRVAADGTSWLRYTGELQVAYFNEMPDPRYREPMAPLGPPSAPGPAQRQVSRLRSFTEAAEVQPNGSLTNPLDVLVSGYLGFEKIGEFLPLNYVPPASLTAIPTP